jgi:predicted ester cyclase
MDQPHKQAQIEQLFDHLNRRALDRLDGLLHPDYLGHTQHGEIRGIPAFTEFVQTCWLNPFPDARIVVSNIVLDGDLASWQIRFTGTNSAGVAPACLAGLSSAQSGLVRWSLMGMPPTGASIDVTSLHLGRLDRGRLIEHWMVNDQLAMLPQSPLPERPASTPR